MIDDDDGVHPAAGLRRADGQRPVGGAEGACRRRACAGCCSTCAATRAGRSTRRSASSNEFLPQGQMIVYTRGRVPNSDQDYRATERGQYTDLPLVVLANRNSASASEIVTGALQDHDRAVIVGETTFGKALVQSVYRISEGAALALTTARYYTPSGRLIQRPWDGTFDEYLTYTVARPGRAARAHGGGAEVHRRRAQGVRRRRHRARPPAGRAGRGLQSRPRSRRLLYARQVFASFAQKFSAVGDTRIAVDGARPQVRGARTSRSTPRCSTRSGST